MRGNTVASRRFTGTPAGSLACPAQRRVAHAWAIPCTALLAAALAGNACTARAAALDIRCSYAADHLQPRVDEPAQLIGVGTDIRGRRQRMAPEAAAALSRMREAAARDGITLLVVSAFRSIEYQRAIVRRKLARGQSIGQILRVNAAPGYSQHHSGRAVDLATPGYGVLETGFEDSPAFAWLQRHAARFGFRLSYPRNNVHHIDYEPWHWYWNPDDAPPARASIPPACSPDTTQVADAKQK